VQNLGVEEPPILGHLEAKLKFCAPVISPVRNLQCLLEICNCLRSALPAFFYPRGLWQFARTLMQHKYEQVCCKVLLRPGCEDIIAEALTVDSLPSVLQWSSKPHGSIWVHRQAIQFLREEFSQLVQPCHLPVLYELSRDYLLDAVSSDFLQVGPSIQLPFLIRFFTRESRMLRASLPSSGHLSVCHTRDLYQNGAS